MKEVPGLLDAISLRQAVVDKLSTISAVVHDRVVDHFVERETGRRADAIVRGLDQMADLDREIGKIDKPDQKSLDAAGHVVSQTFSQGRWDQLQKLHGKRQKLTEALDAALDGDMNRLNNLNKGGDQKDKVEVVGAEEE